MTKMKGRIPGIIISAVLTVVVIAFIILLVWTQMLPTHLLILGSIAIVLIAVAAGLLVRRTAYKVQFTFGTILAVLLTAVLAFAGSYLYMTVNTLNQISSVRTQYTPVGIYVRTDDPAQTIADTQGYHFGILKTLDRENTDNIVSQIEDQLGGTIQTTEYEGLTQMIDALLEEETDAVIMNLAYLDVLSELDKYRDIESRIRELSVLHVETIVEEQPVQTQDENITVNKEVYTIYVSGSDTRQGLNTVGRSDVNIIATVNTETRQILLVTTPRDYFVPLSISNGVPDKLTHAGIYGVNVSMETLEMLYETDIDYYFRLNFTGFTGIVDALGGITVDNEVEFEKGNYYYPVGKVEMDGKKALTFARERYSFIDGDIQRGKNQLKVISAIIDKAMSPDILMNYASIMKSIEDCFEMDVPYNDIAALVRRQLSDNRNWNVVQYSVTGFGDSQIPYSMSDYAYVMQPDYETVNKAKELMKKVRDGEIVVINKLPTEESYVDPYEE
ncbi:LCP family protein [Anaeromassilibacillus senegalensis]|nr:LCP family protein [Anaeromassilibacillus senegalensis]